MHMHRILVSYVASPGPQLFPNYLIHGTILERRNKKKVIKYKMYVEVFSETFLILRLTQRNTLTKAHWSARKNLLFMSDFNKT